MFDAIEICLSWRGTLDTLSTVPQSKCGYIDDKGILRDNTGKLRSILHIEETIVDSTLGKLVWAKRLIADSTNYKDVLVKKPSSQRHSKQEAVIQWLCYKALLISDLASHCPEVYDIFTYKKEIWFSMAPIYNAPILDAYLKSLSTWRMKHSANGHMLLKIILQIAMCCHVLERIGFNHRDLKPDNILIKSEDLKVHSLITQDYTITIQSSPTATLVDFGFSCLGPGKIPWIQAGDDVLSSFDACPRVGRDIFMLLVFLLWRKDIQESLTDEHLDFLKSSLRLTTERWKQMQRNSNPVDWIYTLITERGFECPALTPLTRIQTCATRFPELVSITNQPGSLIV
jgi:serine/threonine protein kinase